MYRLGCFEHFIIHNLRNDSSFIKELDYVLEVNNEIIANIVYAKRKLKLNNNKIDVLTFGPVSVKNKYQRKDFGKKIINYSLKKAKLLNYPFVLIIGDHNYYHKYGFESASKYDIYYNRLNQDEESPFFMIKILNDVNINDFKGIYYNPECYNVDLKKLELFDKKIS